MTIHGFLTVTADFGRLYDYLDMYDEVKAVEIPGHNGEKPDFAKFTAEATFRTVLDAYDELAAKYDSVDVVGFSMGGTLATWISSVRPVNREVLISPGNKYINAVLPFEIGKFVNDISAKVFRETEGNLQEKLDAVNTALEPYKENAQTASKVAKARTLHYMNPHTFSVFRKIIKSSNVVVETTTPHTTPTLILWGKLDELVPQSSIKYITKHFPEAQVKIYPDVGHAMLYTNFDDVIIHDIVEFLTEGKTNLTVPKRA